MYVQIIYEMFIISKPLMKEYKKGEILFPNIFVCSELRRSFPVLLVEGGLHSLRLPRRMTAPHWVVPHCKQK